MRRLSPMRLSVIFALMMGTTICVAAESPADGTILQRLEVTFAHPDSAAAFRLERIIYASDGLEVEAYLARPTEITAPLPCVIRLRGGNRNFGAWSDERAYKRLGPMAARGYIVVATQYRGNGQFGSLKYPGDRICPGCDEAIGGKGREEFGGAEVDDVLALIPLLENLPGADAQRLGLFGWSRGGMMTYLTLRASDRFRAAIVGAGVADAVASFAQRPGMATHVYAELIPGWADSTARQAALEARSAVLWADQLPASTPILLLHGSGDWRVDPTQALDMARALLKARRPFRLVMLEGGDHGLTEYDDEVWHQVYHWLDHYVRDGASWPSLEPHGR